MRQIRTEQYVDIVRRKIFNGDIDPEMGVLINQSVKRYYIAQRVFRFGILGMIVLILLFNVLRHNFEL